MASIGEKLSCEISDINTGSNIAITPPINGNIFKMSPIIPMTMALGTPMIIKAMLFKVHTMAVSIINPTINLCIALFTSFNTSATCIEKPRA